MNRGEMKAYLRLKLQDQQLDYLFPDEELEDAIQDAQCEGSVRCDLIIDKNSELTTFSTVIGGDSYPISRLFYRVKSVIVNGRRLQETTRQDVERLRCVTPAIGFPSEWFFDSDGSIHFDRAANAVYEVKFEGHRYPQAMLDDDAECEVPDATGSIHRKLLLWAMKLLKEKEDLEVERQGDAARHEAAFDREFSPIVNVGSRVERARSSRRQVRPNFW
jgi:hypothetical protein